LCLDETPGDPRSNSELDEDGKEEIEEGVEVASAAVAKVGCDADRFYRGAYPGIGHTAMGSVVVLKENGGADIQCCYWPARMLQAIRLRLSQATGFRILAMVSRAR